MQPTDDPELDAAVEKLLQQCRERGHAVSINGTVDPHVAAELCGRSLQTLANWRTPAVGRGPHFRRRAGRIEYRLGDIADWLLTPEKSPADE